jgi:hypothetical protein
MNFICFLHGMIHKHLEHNPRLGPNRKLVLPLNLNTTQEHYHVKPFY